MIFLLFPPLKYNTGRYIIYRIVNCASLALRNGGYLVKMGPVDSLFTKSPPFLRDIIFISRKHSLLFSIYYTLSYPECHFKEMSS